MRIKGFLILQVVIVIIAVTVGQIGKAQMPKCGIQNVTQTEQLYDMDIQLADIAVLTDDLTADSFVKYQEDYIQDVDAASIVAIIKPTGNIRIYYYSYCQEVTIERVLQGDANLEGSTIYIYEECKFAVNNEMNNSLAYYDVKNIMQENHNYLAFFNQLELNSYYVEDAYSFVDPFFSCLDLSSNNSTPIEEALESLDFKNYKDIEFFTGSEAISQAMIDIKQKIIEKYMK